MKHIYYAHPMSWYDTEDEKLDLEFLKETFKGSAIINPNSARFHNEVQNIKSDGGDSSYVMYMFTKYIATSIDVVVFRAFKDGTVGSGVAKEVFEAIVTGKVIYEIFTGVDGVKRQIFPIDKVNFIRRVIGVETTRLRVRNGIL